MPGERIYFQLRFFLFPVVRTAAATIATKAGEATLLRSAVSRRFELRAEHAEKRS